MKPDFDKLPWHDAELRNIFIDRSDPGHIDEVSLDIVWPDKTKSRIKFLQCYQLEANMNFNIIALESIRTAFLSRNNPKIDTVKHKWCEAGASLEDLKLFYIETNSTASIIEIIAIDFSIQNNI